MSDLSIILKSINMKTQKLDNEFISKSYIPFVINRIYSSFMDTIFHSYYISCRPEMEIYDQYLYYYTSITKRNRYYPWKRNNIDNNDLNIICRYYNCSIQKAIVYNQILTDEQLTIIKNKMKVGGVENE